ncbi:helix-turn-helix transcriptional regulator [Actinocorallia sp. A-T 12471]|uniref:helix-turn-helix domain-containing protein n=1 Tax=Actinocorallia sp. A-T 12471 TaxID=3089813 RepID=UPI0029D3B469|nr:helix-turn-helix transcriptional regulator [Actinocorallia sp. A-T 12471]MDX6744594.1 helix-turn-helix transcriptional regulator [Actinocorallia sp. A-T 12471]
MTRQFRPPTARIRRLAVELTALRQQRRLSRDEVTNRTDINQVTLYRIETGRARPQLRTLNALLELYEVPEQKRGLLRRLLQESTNLSWLQKYSSGIQEAYGTYISFEAEAYSIRTFEPVLIPGLLQTEAYTRTLTKAFHPKLSVEAVEDRVEIRKRRKELLLKDDAPQFWAIIDEAALRRAVGSPDLMREQAAYILACMDYPTVTVQVLPFAAGAHPALASSFVVLGFREPIAAEVVYIESLASSLFLEEQDIIEQHTSAFEHLRAVASSPAATADFLATLARS